MITHYRREIDGSWERVDGKPLSVKEIDLLERVNTRRQGLELKGIKSRDQYAQIQEEKLAKGRALWAEIHKSALDFDDGKIPFSQFSDFLRNIVPERIPGCIKCRKHYEAYLIENPFPSERMFNWTVDLHNRVNAHLDKPILSYNDALKIWSA